MAPRLYTIPPSSPFLTTLARALLGGHLPVPGGPKPDPLTLPLATIYLPTRRAARGLREAFLREARGAALLLPRIRALGDPDEESAIILGAEEDTDGAGGTPAIGALPRRLTLMRLVLAFGRRLAAEAAAEQGDEAPPLLQPTPGQASHLAADLARLMDSVESEEVDLTGLARIMPDELANHWRLTVEFLKIVTHQWPHYLAEQGLASPVARRNALMAIEATRLASGAPHPVIAAGSTGTVPATARLLEVVANLPNGAVVLPGLDHLLDEESWSGLSEHPEHPQAGMAELLRRLGAGRGDVAYVAGSEPGGASRARLRLISEALRPAETTDHWAQFLDSEASGAEARATLAEALDGIRLVVAPNAHDEAEAIALILRSCIETPGKTAALVTPDRVLARRVAARLRHYNLAIDDSAGLPVGRTIHGAFLDLVLGAVETQFAPSAMMALLKHPLALLGRGAGETRRTSRALERGAFRDVYVGQGLAGVRAALLAARNEERRRPLITEAEQAAALKLVDELEAALAPLVDLFAGKATHSAAALAKAHAASAEALARDASGSSPGLWEGDAGEAISVLLAEVIGAGDGLDLSAADYAPFYRSLVASEVVRPRIPAHPRLFIWGPLEARLQQTDAVILGSLNEGVWPRPQDAGPWLSRPIREALGLSPPERRTGLAAHDFAQALGTRTVYLTRALKVDGVPTVPSRWLQRLLALVEATGLQQEIVPKESWIAWARARDTAPDFEPAKPPSPKPPLEARPRRLSVTRIERWIANPYEIFAAHILKLERLKPLGTQPDAATRGSVVHNILSDFATAYPDTLPEDIEKALSEIANEHFSRFGRSPRIDAFWRPHFARFARWFAVTEPARRADALGTHAEVAGELGLGTDFTLTARADRIDLASDGRVTIYDYKTGNPPSQGDVDGLVAPQLSLEAAIAKAGGFEALGQRAVSGLRYIRVSGRDDGGEDTLAGKTEADALAAEARDKLERLVAQYRNPDIPYEVKRRRAFTKMYRYDDYEQLARVKEWLTQEEQEDW